MFEEVSVEEAIKKGHKEINYPGTIIILLIFATCIFLVIKKIIPVWSIPIGLAIAIAIGWLYWSIMITKWRIWAFENVRNVHELKQRAIDEKLIWPDKSFFEKTEIRTSIEKEKWNQLLNKFNREDIFIDIVSIQQETIIYYSKTKIYFGMCLLLFLLASGIFMIYKGEIVILGVAFTLLGGYLSYKEYKLASDTRPQIILSNTGMETVKTNFYSWEKINNEKVIHERTGRSIDFFLTFNHPYGKEKIKINDFHISEKRLTHLLKIYRGRSVKNNK